MKLNFEKDDKEHQQQLETPVQGQPQPVEATKSKKAEKEQQQKSDKSEKDKPHQAEVRFNSN